MRVGKAVLLQYCLVYTAYFGDCVRMRRCASYRHHLDAHATSTQKLTVDACMSCIRQLIVSKPDDQRGTLC